MGQASSTIKELNPEIELVFTVSPVRHIKDGLAENTRSKARLFELISLLEKEHELTYFPAYEIMTDELRDYRFYKEDLVHPSETAISYIWEKLTNAYCSPETKKTILKMEQLRKLSAHRIMTEESKEAKAFEASKNQQIQSFLEANPDVNW